jgi:eukaryotic-like serine/threonine-protein kinase
MSDAPGAKIAGRYELVEPVGQGGMAVVWRANTIGPGGFARPVAVKRIREELRGLKDVVELFIEEARVDAKLRHPNVVQIHDFGLDEGGDPFLVTEWVEGIHFGQYLGAFQGGERAPFDLVAAIGVEVLRGLDAAHTHEDSAGQAAPILHRDVTPENILLDELGFVKVTDFGMARSMDRGRMTHPDIIKGKISYMAPEMTRGIGPNEQTDVWGVGVVLWEALAGERLFDAPTDGEVFRMLMAPRVPLLAMKRPELPLSLCRIVHRALEADPARRYATAREMLRALATDLRALPRPIEALALGESVRAARQRLARAAPGRRVDAHARSGGG